MVFSLFGKKPPARKPVSIRAAQPGPPKPPEAPGTGPAAAVDRGLDQLPPTEPLPDLDFSMSVIALHISPEEFERMELREGSSRVHPVVEEAAILYANGGAAHAVEVLEAAIQRDDLEAVAPEIWRLLFELYQVLGMREAFERRALEFVVRFETSPPAWTAAAQGSADPGMAAAPVCNLNGALSAASAKQFEQMQRILTKNNVVRLDVAKVNGADAEGSNQFHALLAAAKKQKRTIIVDNAAVLARLLQSKIAIGKPDRQPMWLLLLELLQQEGDQGAFEEWALNYAITFEVSPPSWEPPTEAPKAAAIKAPGSEIAAQGDTFAMSGEMLGANSKVFVMLNEFGLRHDPVLVDLSGVKRMDFVCAGMMLNTLSDLAARGKAIRLANASALVAALLRVVGIHQLAEIIQRRV